MSPPCRPPRAHGVKGVYCYRPKVRGGRWGKSSLSPTRMVWERFPGESTLQADSRGWDGVGTGRHGAGGGGPWGAGLCRRPPCRGRQGSGAPEDQAVARLQQRLQAAEDPRPAAATVVAVGQAAGEQGQLRGTGEVVADGQAGE